MISDDAERFDPVAVAGRRDIERDYLQQKLDEKLVGLNDEGEIVALDDLLDDQKTG